MCVSARQVKAHVVSAPNVVASLHVSVVKILCESSVASQVNVVNWNHSEPMRMLCSISDHRTS